MFENTRLARITMLKTNQKTLNNFISMCLEVQFLI